MADYVSCGFVPTGKFSGEPVDIADFAESIWNMDIRENDEYELHAYATSYSGDVQLDSPSDFDDAYSQVANSDTVQDYLRAYDAVIVIDDRDHLDGPIGRAIVDVRTFSP